MNEPRTYHNPVQRGFFPDPSVIRVGDDYYMVNSSFQYFPAIPISHSRDMVHWHIIGHAITNPEWLDISDIRDSHGIWAPDIEYVDGKYYVYVTLRLNADGKRDNNVMRRQLVMVSDKPEGPYSKPVCLEVDDIDPSLFVDDDGSRYMIIAKAAQAVPLTADGLAVAGPAKTAWEGTGERCSEGPHIMKKDGYYYAIVAEGGTGYGHGINVEEVRISTVLMSVLPIIRSCVRRTLRHPFREPDTASWYRIRTVSGGAIISAEDPIRGITRP